jgi:radical SAM superfamily enzyme YgiQ (UPF0313 family)
LNNVIKEGFGLCFHTPNALHARFLTPEIARLMVEAGFQSFFLGFESGSSDWLNKTGGKLSPDDFSAAVAALRRAGARHITAYLMIGHPDAEEQELTASMHYAHRQGARILLSEFAPVPGTFDGERCRPWADLDEPLSHNKTAFTIRRLGLDCVNRLKASCRELNSKVPPARRGPRVNDSGMTEVSE